jgi:murein DD-endopeptidase MepM/ murein hydrolase activator NlpD
LGGLLTSVVKEILLRLLIEGRHACAFIPQTIFHALRCGTVPVKDRHVYTRSGRLRLRYIALMAAAFLGIASTNLTYTPDDGIDVASAQASIAPNVDVASIEPAASEDLPPAVYAPPAPIKPVSSSYTRKLKIKAGDTLSDLMQSAALDASRAADAIEVLRTHMNPREIKAGQSVTMHYDWSNIGGEQLTSMEFSPTPLTRVVLSQGANGFKVEKLEKTLSHEVRAAKATIRTSLYGDLEAAGVPDSIIAEFIKAYSYNVDFQRDIWAGDRVELLYDVNKTADGAYVRGETLKYAALYLRGKPSVIFRFEHEGTVEYFDDKGNPVKKALMRTPIDGAHITSGFGQRHHPILGYTRMHKGVDFGAPMGTPIFAAGDGVVERSGWSNGYGKFILIRHNGTYETAYGHMSALIAKAGQRVKQGQVIGRVGMTGYATGPHLHFEVRIKGSQVNPIKVANLSIGNKLAGKQLTSFKATMASAKANFSQIIASGAQPQLASVDGQ